LSKNPDKQISTKSLNMSHDHPDLPHYHLCITRDYGNNAVYGGFEIPSPLFLNDCPERGVSAATLGDVKWYVRDRYSIETEFYLCWKGVVLGPDTMKLSDIEVAGQRIRLYVPDPEEATLIVHMGSPP
jgi:hypothetical protein